MLLLLWQSTELCAMCEELCRAVLISSCGFGKSPPTNRQVINPHRERYLCNLSLKGIMVNYIKSVDLHARAQPLPLTLVPKRKKEKNRRREWKRRGGMNKNLSILVRNTRGAHRQVLDGKNAQKKHTPKDQACIKRSISK